jgi:serine/threonine protein kinase
MASVHFGLLLGDEGFTKTVAIKRLHASFAKDPEFASALLDEGRLQARIHHPNVAAVLDVVRSGDELLLVMEYLHAAPLSQLHQAARAGKERPSLAVARAVMVGVLRGLHDAHEARSANGEPLAIVHRDISPQNILVGADGTARIVDFGIARAAVRSQVTREGVIKGKPGYMAPEQFSDDPVSRAVDIYAAGVVLWELVTSERLFAGGDIVAIARKVIDGRVDPPSAVVPGLPAVLDAIVLKALARDPAERFATASELADALEGLGPLASPGEVAAWVQRSAGEALAERQAVRSRIEREAEHERARPQSSSPDAASSGTASLPSTVSPLSAVSVASPLSTASPPSTVSPLSYAVTVAASYPVAASAPGSFSTTASSAGIPSAPSLAVVDAAALRRSRVAYGIVAAMALLVAAAGGAALAGGASRSEAPAAETTSSLVLAAAPSAPSAPQAASSAAPSTPPAASAAAPIVAPAAVFTDAPPASAGSTPEPVPPVAPTAPVKRASGPAAPPRALSAAPPPGPCSTVGKDGIKRWNPKCK